MQWPGQRYLFKGTSFLSSKEDEKRISFVTDSTGFFKHPLCNGENDYSKRFHAKTS